MVPRTLGSTHGTGGNCKAIEAPTARGERSGGFAGSRASLTTSGKETLDDPALDRIAVTESHAWVERLRAQVATQGRRVEGGWPGTLSEARLLVVARLSAGAGPGPAMTRALFELLVKSVYTRARREWLACAG